ncbi:MAG: XRE family transcriptional regulator [Bacteroidetes bacterium]|nr:MAG: XRE family transcriptional regulator [Bacteroidota bacterium]
MEIHIGEKIRQQAKELRMGPTELAQLINTSRSNIYWLYKRKHIDGEMLVKLSRVLKFNFFRLYRDEAVLGKAAKTAMTGKTQKIYDIPQEEMQHLYSEVAELKEKYNVLAKSFQKKKKK